MSWVKVESPISDNQRTIPKHHGVYCFYEVFAGKSSLVYIGSTKNLYFRISTHTKFNHPFDKSLFVKYKACANPIVLGERLIKRLKPSMNQLIDGRIIKVTIQSEEWKEKLRKQREWRATKKNDPEFQARNRANVRKCLERRKQSEEYILTKKKEEEQKLVERRLHDDWLGSDQGKMVIRFKGANRQKHKYHKNPGKHREKKNLFKVFGTKKDITFPLRKSIALVHLGRRLVRGGWQGGNQLPIDKERVSQIVERINQGETYAAYE